MSFSLRTSKWFSFSGASLLLGVSLLAAPLPGQSHDNTQQPAPDNTQVNQRDRDSSQPTADQQKDNRSDRNITQQIRQSIMKDKSLSSYAHNVKVISQNGTVTLHALCDTAEGEHGHPRLHRGDRRLDLQWHRPGRLRTDTPPCPGRELR